MKTRLRLGCRVSRALSAQNRSPFWSPLHTWFTLPSPLWACQEPPDVPSLCGKSPQLLPMHTGEQWQGWAGRRTLQSGLLRNVGSGKGKPCLWPGPGWCPCYLVPAGGKAVRFSSVCLRAAVAIARPPALTY